VLRSLLVPGAASSAGEIIFRSCQSEDSWIRKSLFMVSCSFNR